MKYLLLIALACFSLSVFARAKLVIGSDERYKISNENRLNIHDSIGLIDIDLGNQKAGCTGTVIGPRHVVTAAHCVLEKGELVKNISFSPGYSKGGFFRSSAPFGKFKASKIVYNKEFLKVRGPRNDLALLIFEENFTVPALPIAVAGPNNFDIAIAGYPGDKPFGTLWEAQGQRLSNEEGEALPTYQLDTYGGQSGSAVRMVIDDIESVVGVHSSGVRSLSSPYNEALFFTEADLEMINIWMEQN
jgi:glutamyl endopeptidase